MREIFKIDPRVLHAIERLRLHAQEIRWTSDGMLNPSLSLGVACLTAAIGAYAVFQILAVPEETKDSALRAQAGIQVLAMRRMVADTGGDFVDDEDVAPLSWSPQTQAAEDLDKDYEVRLVSLDADIGLRPTFEVGENPAESSYDPASEGLVIPTVEEDEVEEQVVRIGRGDTLGEVLMDAGATPQDAHYAVKALKPHLNPRRLQVGQEIALKFTTAYEGAGRGETELTSMTIDTDVDRQVVVTLDENDQYTSKLIINELTEGHLLARGTIDNSLYLTALKLDVPDQVIGELIRIFSFDIDFQRDIRKGDDFEIFYSRFYDDAGNALRDGTIRYASLTVRGKPRAYYRFRPSDDGIVDYFDARGQSAKKFLMRTPVEGARLSSNYGRRKHPVLGYTRMHKGVDFAAPRGTPIMAAGKGVVEKAQRWGGFGNYVRIRHNGTYATAYAHMHRFARGIRKGSRVRQGQIIGYVGTTGRSTGPHLHYEVLLNKKQVNPRNIKVPTGRKLSGKLLTVFKSERTNIDMAMAETPVTTMLAAAPPRLIDPGSCSGPDVGEVVTC